jgi:type I restriction enzyme S subunit
VASNKWAYDMSHVASKRLGDLINLKRGYDLPENQRRPGPYPVISSAGITGYHDEYMVEGTGVVTGRYGTLGEMYYVDGKYWPHNTALYVTTFKGNDPKYIYYLLSCLGRIRTSDKSAVPGVNRNELHEMAIPAVTDKNQQQKIAAVLSALDAKIDCNNRINTELEAMAKTLYDYWFVQFDFPDANGNPYKSSGGKMLYNATLKREIPAGWSDAVVADILDKSPSSTKILNKDIRDSGAIPVIDQSQSYICGFTDEKTSLIVPKQPHVVFGDHTRAVKLVNFSYARGADGTQILVSKDMRMPGYLMYQAVSDIDLSSYGYARHFKFLKESKILLPDKAIAQKYQVTVTPWFEKTREVIFENLELARLRDWLLPLLMNGQVTVA